MRYEGRGESKTLDLRRGWGLWGKERERERGVCGLPCAVEAEAESLLRWPCEMDGEKFFQIWGLGLFEREKEWK